MCSSMTICATRICGNRRAASLFSTHRLKTRSANLPSLASMCAKKYGHRISRNIHAGWRSCKSELPGQPLDNIGSASIRREHGIKDVFYDTVVDNQREPLQKCHPACLEGRQDHRAGELQVFVGEEREGQMQALRCFALVIRFLRGEAEEMLDAQRLQFREMVTEGA